MQARILDMDELSDSVEMYESKPNKICEIFIYFVLIIERKLTRSSKNR